MVASSEKSIGAFDLDSTRVRAASDPPDPAASRRVSSGAPTPVEPEPRRIARAEAHDDRRLHRQIDDRRRRRRAGAGVDDEVEHAAERVADRLGVVQRLGRAGQDQRRRQDRLAQLREQRLHDGVIRHAHADRAALRMLQPPRHLARCRQQEGEACPACPGGRSGTASCRAARNGRSRRDRAAPASGDDRRRRRESAGCASPPPRRRCGSRARSSNRSDRRSRRRRAGWPRPAG